MKQQTLVLDLIQLRALEEEVRQRFGKRGFTRYWSRCFDESLGDVFTCELKLTSPEFDSETQSAFIKHACKRLIDYAPENFWVEYDLECTPTSIKFQLNKDEPTTSNAFSWITKIITGSIESNIKQFDLIAQSLSNITHERGDIPYCDTILLNGESPFYTWIGNKMGINSQHRMRLFIAAVENSFNSLFTMRSELAKPGTYNIIVKYGKLCPEWLNKNYVNTYFYDNGKQDLFPWYFFSPIHYIYGMICEQAEKLLDPGFYEKEEYFNEIYVLPNNVSFTIEWTVDQLGHGSFNYIYQE